MDGDQTQQELKVLILEDVATDAELIERALRKAGLRMSVRRADSRAAFIKALEEQAPDIILSDYNLPDLNGLEALELARSRFPDTPVIEVTGALGDEAAVALVRAGARDYVLKDRLARLPFAVEHALSDAREAHRRKEAEAALRQSEQRYRDIVETSSDWIWEVDADGAFTYSSPRSEVIIGYGSAELIGRRFLALMPGPESARVGALFQEARANREGFTTMESVMTRKDGGQVVLETSGQPILGPEGAFLGYRGIARDITERKGAEQALLESERRLATLLDVMVDGVIVTDRQTGRFVLCNPAICQMLGYSQDELLDLDVRDLHPPAAVAQVLHNYETGARQVPETAMKRKDGSVFYVSISGSDMVLGGRRLAVAVFRDITETKRIERERAMQAAVISAVQETSLDGILVVDPSGKVLARNHRFEVMFDLSAEALASGADERMLDEVVKLVRGPEAFLEGVKALYAQPDATSRDEVVFKDGRILDRYSAPVRLPGGEHIGRVWFFRDITERKQAEEKIREDEARFRALIEQELAGIYIIAPGGTLAYVNPRFAQMLGYAPDEVIGRPFLDFIGDTERETASHMFAAEMSGEPVPAQLATVIRRKDGAPVDVLVQGAVATYQGQPADIGVVLDITDLKRAEASLRRLNRTLLTLSAGNEALVRAKSEPELLNEMCRVLVDRGGYRMAWIGMPRRDQARSIEPVAMAAQDPSKLEQARAYLDQARITWGDAEHGSGVTGLALRTGEPQTSQSFDADPRMGPWRELAQRHGFASSIALPLKDAEGVFGVISIYSGEPDAFTEDELKLLRELANDLAYGIGALRDREARETGVQRLRRTMEATIGALASTVEMRDPYTAGHQHRVADLAVAVAREMKLPEDRIQGIYLAGLIHDVGKINVPSEILNKPGKLSELEFELIHEHAHSGFEVVKGVDFPWPIADTILQHHERLDGSGYPGGLKGDQILLEARILAVADVVEAMMSHRPYRPALGIDAALGEIRKESGVRYDAEVVNACLSVFQKGFSFG